MHGRRLVLWGINTAALMALPYIVPDVHVTHWLSALAAAALLGLLNTFFKPILQLLTLPLQIITLGLFTWVINACFMLLAGNLFQGFEVNGFWSALLASVVYSLITWAGATILLPSKKS